MLMVSCQVSIVPNRKNDGAQSTTIITHTTKTMPVRCTDVGGEPVEDGEFRRYLGWKYHVRFIRRVLARCLLVPAVHLIVLSPEHLPVPLTIAPVRLSPIVYIAAHPVHQPGVALESSNLALQNVVQKLLAAGRTGTDYA